MIEETSSGGMASGPVLATVLEARGRLECRAAGVSMGAWGKAVDTLVLAPPPGDPVTPGTVVVYPRGDVMVAHRVVRRYREGGRWHYLTWGDGAGWADPDPVSHATLLAVVIEVRGPSGTVNLATCRRRALARWRVVVTLLSAALRHPRMLVRRVLAPRKHSVR